MADYVRVPAHQIAARLGGLDSNWHIVRGHELEREWRFPDFASALAFTNAVGAAAEEMNHHPEIELGWGRVKLRIWTHAVSGLTEHDFELAQKVDGITS